MDIFAHRCNIWFNQFYCASFIKYESSLVDMCYSPEVSFGTWIFGLIASIYLYYNNKPFLFPLVVSQMQLVEGLRWTRLVDETIIAIMDGYEPKTGKERKELFEIVAMNLKPLLPY